MMDQAANFTAKDLAARRFDRDIGCRIIAAMQIIGGIFFFGTYFYQYGLTLPDFSIALLLTPGAWGIYAGALLWMGYPRGLNHSLFVQAIQILTLEGPAIAWRLYLGLEINIGWLNPNQVIDIGLGGSSSFIYNNESLSFGLAVNVVAIAAIKYLLYFRRKQEKKWSLETEYERLAAENR